MKKTKGDFSNQAIGMRLKELRQKNGYTQSEIAKRLGLTRSSIANWEHGTRTPDFFYVKHMCRIYKVPVDFVYGTSDHEYKIQIPDYFEMDFTRLNDDGMIMLYDYYKYLTNNPRYRD